MRLFLAVLALGLALSAVPARAQSAARVALMSATDVVNAKRCAPPFGCEQRKRKLPAPHSMFALVDQVAAAERVPARLARALVRIESNFDPARRGRAGEWGLTQIKCRTAKGLGFAGACSALADPRVNLTWGLRHARRALDRGSIGFHQAGLGARRFSPRYVARINAASKRAFTPSLTQ